MAHRSFTSSQLYALRNEINIQMLVEQTLLIPCRMTQGCFRFECPLCKGFESAVNPRTNLARCFACEKNFNTIDLVMRVRKIDFIQSVKFLQSIIQQNPIHPDVNSLGVLRMKQPPRSRISDTGPSHIGKILDNVLTSEPPGIPEQLTAEYRPNIPQVAPEKADEDRLIKLERHVKYLSRQIQKLTRTINAGLPSK